MSSPLCKATNNNTEVCWLYFFHLLHPHFTMQCWKEFMSMAIEFRGAPVSTMLSSQSHLFISFRCPSVVQWQNFTCFLRQRLNCQNIHVYFSLILLGECQYLYLYELMWLPKYTCILFINPIRWVSILVSKWTDVIQWPCITWMTSASFIISQWSG